jgi:hypothetical protein
MSGKKIRKDRTYRNLTAGAGFVGICIIVLLRATLGHAATPPCRYTVANGTVRDLMTKLVWQQAAAPGSYTWAEAATYCASLTVEGTGGWRLPTIKELLTIVDDSKSNPAVDTTYFPGTSGDFWSSTAMAGTSSSAWNLSSDWGYPDPSLPPTSKANVRCVR